MDQLNKLGKLINIDFSKLKNFTLHVVKDSTFKLIEYTDNKRVTQITINIDKIDSKTLPKFQKYLQETVKENSGLLIETTAQKTIEDFKEIDNEDRNKNLLEFFRGKISSTDLEILRASLYLKAVYERGEPVHNLKLDIINNYGERGRNISNLCTAGYFSSQIRPLYEEMASQSNFSRDKFDTMYELIVTESPYALFISNNMSYAAVKKDVDNKIEVGKKYGIKYLNIHGIGKDNVDKIARLVKDLTPQLTQLPEISKGDGNKFITVKIWF